MHGKTILQERLKEVAGFIYGQTMIRGRTYKYMQGNLYTPQAFWQSSASAALSTLVSSVVLYSLTRATLMSPGKDETRVCGYTYIYTSIPH